MMKKLLLVLVFVGTCMPLAYYYLKPPDEESLDIINPADVEPEMVDPELRKKGIDHRIEDFSFKNQNGQWIDSKQLEGKIWVVEYFFATCKGICPVMNKQMQGVQEAYKMDDNVVILSFTVDPKKDSVEALKRYADDHGAIADKWHFFTGDKKELYKLARNSFFVLKPAEAENLGDAGSDFIHTNNFVLVDQKRRIRGYYDGTDPDEVNELIKDIKRLADEKKRKLGSSFPWALYLGVMGLLIALTVFLFVKDRKV